MGVENCPIPLHWPLAYTTACAGYGTLTADDALAVNGDGDGKALHVGHVDAQYLAVLGEAPDANVLAAARCHQLRTVTNNTHTCVRAAAHHRTPSPSAAELTSGYSTGSHRFIAAAPLRLTLSLSTADKHVLPPSK